MRVLFTILVICNLLILQGYTPMTRAYADMHDFLSEQNATHQGVESAAPLLPCQEKSAPCHKDNEDCQEGCCIAITTAFADLFDVTEGVPSERLLFEPSTPDTNRERPPPKA